MKFLLMMRYAAFSHETHKKEKNADSMTRSRFNDDEKNDPGSHIVRGAGLLMVTVLVV